MNKEDRISSPESKGVNPNNTETKNEQEAAYMLSLRTLRANSVEELAEIKRDSLELSDDYRMNVHKAIVKRFADKILVDAVHKLPKK